MNEVSTYGSGGGNTVCHLNTDEAESWFCREISGALGAGSDVVELRCKVNDEGRDCKFSGEPSGDKGSKPKDEHSGSGSKEPDFAASEGSVEGSGMVGVSEEFGAGNTWSRDSDKA